MNGNQEQHDLIEQLNQVTRALAAVRNEQQALRDEIRDVAGDLQARLKVANAQEKALHEIAADLAVMAHNDGLSVKIPGRGTFVGEAEIQINNAEFVEWDDADTQRVVRWLADHGFYGYLKIGNLTQTKILAKAVWPNEPVESQPWRVYEGPAAAVPSKLAARSSYDPDDIQALIDRATRAKEAAADEATLQQAGNRALQALHDATRALNDGLAADQEQEQQQPA